ncbi:hypothetical protein HGA88_03560 [Candidatus Roizmanbacteria bacterium]|nr:hypothetical protein [Candidatus Roizmanbacteria bacterium]
MRWFKLLGFSALVLVLIAISFVSSSDFNQDLGRHIKLGEIILKTGAIPNTNLFTYTNPQFPFVNHHWLFEVIAYLTFHTMGVTPLLVGKALLIIASVLIVWRTAWKITGFWAAIGAATIVIPLLLERPDIRPEVFGYFFFAVMMGILYASEKHPSFRLARNRCEEDSRQAGVTMQPTAWCWALQGIAWYPVLLALWSNVHVTFVFGLFLTIIFIGERFLTRQLSTKMMFFTAVAFFIVPFLNPHGVTGFFYPFFIFQNYGYSIVENQNVFFLAQMTHNTLLPYFFAVSPVVIAAGITLIITKKYRSALILAVFFTLAIYQIRHWPFFVFAAIIPLAEALQFLISAVSQKKPQLFPYAKWGGIIVGIALLLWGSGNLISNSYYRIFDHQRQFGLRIEEDYKKATDFVKANQLPQPIFNNFDNGGYLDYALYPQYKTYVDNRPEAFPAEFLQKKYVQLEQDNNNRMRYFQNYGIQTVIVSHTDATPWAGHFLANMIQDKEFKLVYYDSTSVIFVKNSQLPDVRNDKKYADRAIQTETNAIKLLQLASFYQNISDKDHFEDAFYKAKEQNPDSCTIQRILYSQAQNSPFGNPNAIKQNAWYCF